MADQRKGGISWTDATWNPVRGCTRVSEGCRMCYAETVAARFSGPGQAYEGLARWVSRAHPDVEGSTDPLREARWTGRVLEVEAHLEDPLRWTRPRRVFVNSMSDLFHPEVSAAFIWKVFAVMEKAQRHVFQVLTKRPLRMHDLVNFYWKGGAPAHLWWGVSAEDQATADERIPPLLDTNAAVRFVSAEPLLGPVDLGWAMPWQTTEPFTRYRRRVDWVIVGGESGPGARPMDAAWAHALLAQCRKAGVAFHFKQAGSVLAREWGCKSRKGGDPEEWPAALRVQEYP